MQESPQAFPFLQTLQHFFVSASKLSADKAPSGDAQFVWSSIVVEASMLAVTSFLSVLLFACAKTKAVKRVNNKSKRFIRGLILVCLNKYCPPPCFWQVLVIT